MVITRDGPCAAPFLICFSVIQCFCPAKTCQAGRCHPCPTATSQPVIPRTEPGAGLAQDLTALDTAFLPPSRIQSLFTRPRCSVARGSAARTWGSLLGTSDSTWTQGWARTWRSPKPSSCPAGPCFPVPQDRWPSSSSSSVPVTRDLVIMGAK